MPAYTSGYEMQSFPTINAIRLMYKQQKFREFHYKEEDGENGY